MKKSPYIDFLAELAIADAHPGGHKLTEAIVNKMAIKANDHVLDVGCGTGATTVFLAEKTNTRVTGIDLHPKMVAQARARAKRCTYPPVILQANAEQLPFEAEAFDCLFSESVTAFTDVSRSLPEYFRVLKPGGRLAAIEMTSEQPIAESDKQTIESVYGVADVRTRDEWLDLWKQAGFAKIDVAGEKAFQVDTADHLPAHFLTERVNRKSAGIWLDHILTMQQYHGLLGYHVFIMMKPIFPRSAGK